MITLIVVGFLADVITSISPCVLPVLPVVLTAGATLAFETADYQVQGQVLSIK